MVPSDTFAIYQAFNSGMLINSVSKLSSGLFVDDWDAKYGDFDWSASRSISCTLSI